MNNLLKITSAALLLGAVAVPAIADDNSSKASSSQASSSQASSSQASSSSSQASSSSMESSSSSVSSSSSAEEGGAKVNYGQIISSIQAGKSVNLTAITASSTINFVLVSDVKAHGKTTALENALKKHATAIAKLGTEVEANATLKAKLAAAGYTSDQVVAVLLNADGSFTVVINQ